MRSMKLPVLLAVAVAACAGGCGGCNGGGPADAGALSLVIGTPDVTDEGFTPVTSGSALELYVGQQGAFFARLRYAVPGAAGTRCDVTVHFDIDGIGELDTWNTRAFEDASPYGPVTETHMILLNALVDGTGLVREDLPGHAVTITATITDAEDRTATATTDAVLRDDNACIDCGGGLCLLPGDPNGCSFPPFPGPDAGTDSGADDGV